MKHLFTHPFARVAALTGLLFAALWLVVGPARPARAAGVVTDCTGLGLATAMNSGSGLITFACGPNPVVITVTQAGGFNVVNGQYLTIDGGDKVTLTGAGVNRLFDVQTNAALTLTHIILTNGFASFGGNVPNAGGAILAEGNRLVLDYVTIRDSSSIASGGGIRVETGNVIIKDSLIENNESGYGGGIDSLGALTLINTIVRSNRALVHNGGGLDVGGTVVINNSQFLSNTAAATDADEGGGGLNITGSGLVTISGSRFEANSVPTTTGAYGGAILSVGALTVTQSSFSRNTAYFGGGVFVSGTASFAYTLFDSNLAFLGGGGLYNFVGSTTSMNNAVLINNRASRGAGVYSYLGTLILNNTAVRFNQAGARAGGIYHAAGATTVNNSAINGNSSGNRGGGFYVESGGSLTLNSSTVADNSALAGGAIYNESGTTTVNGSTLSGNSASNPGGGIYNYSTLNLTNSTLSANTTSEEGGGIYNDSMATLMNVTLSNNSAASGGALFTTATATSVLTNTILAYSPTGSNCAGALTASKFSLSSDNSCGLSGLVHNQDPNGLDPLLTALGNYGGPTLTQMPKLGSPAIAGVVGNDAPATDQRGQPRPGPDGNRDIGAVERQPTDSNLAPKLYLPQLVR